MRHSPHFRIALWVAGLALVLLVVVYFFAKERARAGRSPEVPQAPVSDAKVPPWRYGRPDARFLLVSYGDFECPHCKSYFPQLKRWIDTQPDVQWEWRHLPLPEHEPTASGLAQLAECLGVAAGSRAFFDTADWIYQHTRGLGQGVPEELSPPGATAGVQRCIASGQTEPAIRAHVESAASDGIVATPTIQLVDRSSGRTLLLPGPVIGDALLSALDLLTVAHEVERDMNSLPATPPGGTPR
nr:thioredoxin domain-containing protein [uncultured Caldimonas sp.]